MKPLREPTGSRGSDSKPPRPQIYSIQFKTPLGRIVLSATRRGLFSVDFGKDAQRGRAREAVPARIRLLLKRGAQAIRRYLSGRPVEFRHLPVDWSGYNRSEKKVLQELGKIRRGRRQTYQFLALKAGRPKATRYVGRILHMNRLPLVLPCHRIVPKRGGWGGFSRGVRMKRYLLKLETRRVDKKVAPVGHLTGPRRVL